MGAFTLTNGALLGGLALLVAPVIAHLLQRRARKPIVFPSIAFLQATAAQQSRLHKLRRLLLMFLRAAALACIVLAFTRPVWWDTAAGAGERRTATATVFLIDRSLSTSQQSGRGVLFDRLKAEAIRGLDELQQGVDVAAVVWAGDQAEAVFPRLSANLPALRTEVAGGKPGEGRADLPGGMNLATRLLESHAGPRRVVILTDRQATNWKAPGAVEEGVRKPPGVEIVLPEIEIAEASNVSLSAPSMQPMRPRPGAQVDVAAVVSNHSETSRTVTVTAEWVGENGADPVRAQTLTVGTSQSSPTMNQGTAPAQGLASVRWRIQETDALAGDNALWLSAATGRGTPVVIASDDSPEDPGTAAFYLMRALAPFDEQSESRSSFAPRHVTANRLKPADLTDARVLFLGYAGVLSRENAAAIVQFVRRGGALVMLAGDGPAEVNLQLLDEAAKGLLAPWRLLARVEAPRRSPVVIDQGRWNSRWLREFDEPSQLALREIAFRRVWQAGVPAKDAETLFSFASGEPAAGLRHLGNGHLLLLNFSPESTTGDLGKTGTFVALMQMLTSQLTQDEAERTTFLVGERLTFGVHEGTAGVMSVLAPDGTSSPVTVSAGSSEVHAGRASQSGLYRLLVDGVAVSAVAVNVDPRESDLRTLPIADIHRILGAGDSGDGPARGETGRSTVVETRLEGGKPLWGGFLLAGLGAFALELLLLGLWRR